MKVKTYYLAYLLLFISCEKDVFEESNENNIRLENSISSKTTGDNLNNNLPLILSENFKWGVSGHPFTTTEYRPPIPNQNLDEYSNLQIDLLKEHQFDYYRINYETDSTGKIKGYDQFQSYFHEVLTEKLNGNDIKILPVLEVYEFDFDLEDRQLYDTGYTITKGFLENYDSNFKADDLGYKYIAIGNELDNKSIKNSGVDGIVEADYDLKKLNSVKAYLAGMSTAVIDFNILYHTNYKIIVNGGGKHSYYFKYLDQGSINIDGDNKEVIYDIIGFHWYSGNNVEDNPDFYLSTYPNKSIWITEANRTNRDEDPNNEIEQKNRVSSMINNINGRQNIEAFFLYELFNEPRTAGTNLKEANYGITKWSSENHPFLRGQLSYKPVSEVVKFKVEESKHGYSDYIYSLYQTMHQRSANTDDLDYWGTIFKESRDKEKLLQRILPEESYKLFVQEQYRKLLDKEGDQSGIEYWTQRMRNGTSREQVIVDFCSGEDFWNRSNQNNTDFIKRLYKKLLNKNPDNDGLQYWSNRLNNGEPRYSIANLIISSDDFLRRFINEQYKIIFERSGENSGVDYWKNEMKNGLNQQGLIITFLISEEYWNKVIAIGYERRNSIPFSNNQ
ncbi:DUF4214 domain-containing protein [Aquimarina aggregata]|uniref:DUF4214 domain-containing protein n=1 Tax=Aquimarina aggregata TaxID=1642818 RepID=UPI0024929354|nr:DUF4214 domain-containing protein [Aquimarina aggregata]